jgi:hypothetical protein
MPIKEISRRKPGRPRKYGQGRINATVRFTPERYAELRTEADQNGRSVSEQIEHMVEQTRLLRELVGQLKVAFSGANKDGARLRRELDELRAAHAAELDRLKAAAYAIEEKQLAEIVEAAVMRALGKAPRY